MKYRSIIPGVIGLGIALSLSSPPLQAQTSGQFPGQRGPSVQGQREQGQREMKGRSMMETLNLTPAQRSKIQSIRKKQRSDMDALRRAGLPPEERLKRMRAIRAEYRRQVKSILTPAQSAKLDTLRDARRPDGKGRPGRRGPGGAGFMLQSMKTELALTPPQENRIKAILQRAEAQQNRLRAERQKVPGPNPELRRRSEEIRRSTMEQIRAVLTPVQRQKAISLMQDRGNRNPRVGTRMR